MCWQSSCIHSFIHSEATKTTKKTIGQATKKKTKQTTNTIEGKSEFIYRNTLTYAHTQLTYKCLLKTRESRGRRVNEFSAITPSKPEQVAAVIFMFLALDFQEIFTMPEPKSILQNVNTKRSTCNTHTNTTHSDTHPRIRQWWRTAWTVINYVCVCVRLCVYDKYKTVTLKNVKEWNS